MTFDLYLALLGFAFVSSATPGPNNMMLLASGVNFGLRRSLPHMAGILLGMVVMVLLVGVGLAGVLLAWPPALNVLKLASVAYMLWLAWKIANAVPQNDASRGAEGASAAPARPVTLLQAAAFQWVNPKSWIMSLGGIAAYVPHPGAGPLLIAASAFAVTAVPATLIWTLAGQALRRFLSDPRRLRIFNWTMAVLLVASLWPAVTMHAAP